MNYDIWGSWSPTVGPNAPLDDSCAPSQQGSAKSAVKAWTDVDVCGNPNVVGGVFNFWGLVEGGFLTENGIAASGIDYKFDNCSQTVRSTCSMSYLSDHRST